MVGTHHMQSARLKFLTTHIKPLIFTESFINLPKVYDILKHLNCVRKKFEYIPRVIEN